MNNISIAGNIARDIEVRYMPNGDPVGSFAVADNMSKDKGAIFWSCQLFGKRAESLAAYLLKGQAVTVTGNVTEREFTDKNGQQRKVMEVRVGDLALQGGKREGTAPAPAPRPAAKPATGGGGGFESMDDDIPFRDPLARRGYHLVI